MRLGTTPPAIHVPIKAPTTTKTSVASRPSYIPFNIDCCKFLYEWPRCRPNKIKTNHDIRSASWIGKSNIVMNESMVAIKISITNKISPNFGNRFRVFSSKYLTPIKVSFYSAYNHLEPNFSLLSNSFQCKHILSKIYIAKTMPKKLACHLKKSLL